MLFRLVLWLLALRLRWLGKHNAGVQKRLQQQDFVMQWRTVAGEPARWYNFTPGGISSRKGLHPNAQVSLNFSDAKTAISVLKRSAKNQMVFMEAMQKGEVKVDGDAGKLMWFMTLMPFIGPQKKRK